MILCTGSRDFTNYRMVVEVLMQYDPSTTTLIHGGAKGLDKIVDMAGRVMGFTVKVYEADWESEGLRAGLLRNSQMLSESKPDLVLGFRSKLNSKGTNDMLMKAGQSGIPYKIYDDFGGDSYERK